MRVICKMGQAEVKREEAVNALTDFYRSTASSGERAKLEWKAVMAMNAYYKTPGGVSSKKKDMQMVINNLRKEPFVEPKFSAEERKAAVEEIGGYVDPKVLEDSPFEKVVPRKVKGEWGIITLVVGGIVAAWLLLMGRR